MTDSPAAREAGIAADQRRMGRVGGEEAGGLHTKTIMQTARARNKM
jgi:hypothetical protein